MVCLKKLSTPPSMQKVHVFQSMQAAKAYMYKGIKDFFQDFVLNSYIWQPDHFRARAVVTAPL